MVKCETFGERLFRCYYYKEYTSYAKIANNLFTKLLREYSRDTSVSFIELFSNLFSNRAYTGIYRIYREHRSEFKEFCAKIAANLDTFLNTYDVSCLMNEYNYQYKIKGYMGGAIRDKNLNVWFSFKNFEETKKVLDFVCLNNYLYNTVHGTTRDCLAMSTPDNVFYLVNYNDEDYTIRRGFLTSMKNNKLRNRGPHCMNCESNECKPTVINGLERLRVLC